MIAATPEIPSTVAVMDAVPLATPVTVPSALTVATVGAELVHFTVRRSVSVMPAALRRIALSTSVRPLGTRSAAGVSVTDVARSMTTTVASATRPPDSAEMVVVPVLTAETTPAAETVATAGLADDHVIRRPVSTAPAGFRTVAVNVRRSPMNSAAVLTESSVMLPTACGETVMIAESACPATLARMTVVPAARAVTVPWLSTRATAGMLERHETGMAAAPSSYVTVAAIRRCAPSPSVAVLVSSRSAEAPTTVTTTLDLTNGLDATAAVISAVPRATAVRTPPGATVRTVGALDVQTTSALGKAPPAPATRACRKPISPTVRSEAGTAIVTRSGRGAETGSADEHPASQTAASSAARLDRPPAMDRHLLPCPSYARRSSTMS